MTERHMAVGEKDSKSKRAVFRKDEDLFKSFGVFKWLRYVVLFFLSATLFKFVGGLNTVYVWEKGICVAPVMNELLVA